MTELLKLVGLASTHMNQESIMLGHLEWSDDRWFSPVIKAHRDDYKRANMLFEVVLSRTTKTRTVLMDCRRQEGIMLVVWHLLASDRLFWFLWRVIQRKFVLEDLHA
ncbi:hypothetical protein AC578_9853 [Pseudocercospora eumusae]|uniref:Uncharacterized protein n=1 Tax=Pseudocercospora eumusae TaxID=321146 RepID=A0A139HB76_9PEZI|nr:hypothetical protein AC578_9853 [Pseudocercospora eumusae]